MAPIFLCACLRIMRERGANRKKRSDGRNPNRARPAVAERAKVRALGLSLLLVLLALDPQSRKVHNQTGVGGEKTGIGVHIDRSRGNVCGQPTAGMCGNRQ